jgi:hypothetical protein
MEFTEVAVAIVVATTYYTPVATITELNIN